MKIREGFVSNSSSGSFIMHWRVKTFGEVISVTRAVGMAFGVSFKSKTDEGEADEIDWEGTWNKEMRERVEEAIRATIQNDDGTFTTAFWTSMVNSAEDFGESAKSLVMGIVANNDMEIIDKKIESDY